MRVKKLVAHRGDNTHYPENSLAGIESALIAGAVNIELDIQMNIDGSLIVIHDDNYRRTSESSLSIFEVNNEKIKEISVHEPDRFNNEHNPTPVPFLGDVLKLIKHYPQATLFIELKQESISKWGLNKVMNSLLAVVTDYQKQCVIISFNSRALEFTQKYSVLRTGLVFKKAYSKKYKQIAQTLRPDFLICPYTIIPKERLWEGPWEWMVYVVNDLEESKPFFEREDIDYIETDNIQLFLEEK